MTLPNLLIHLALLFLWCRVWTDNDRAFVFNPLVTAPMRAVNRVLGWLRAPLPFLPDRALAAVALLLALALKALVACKLHPPFWEADPPAGNLNLLYLRHYLWCWKTEAAAFLVFTFQIAAINALLLLMSPRRMDRAGQVAELLSRPAGWIRSPALQLPVAFAAIFTCCALPQYAQLFHTGSAVAAKIHASITGASLVSIINILQVWSHCTLLAILFSLLGLLMPRSYAAAYGRDISTLLLGRFSGLLVVGMMDLTPLVFFYAVNWLHGFFMLQAIRLF